jgi:hypothetical protein
MSAREKLVHELMALVQAMLYFTVWLGGLVVLKKLVLDEYRIEFQGLSVALVGALVLSKVVLILENVSLGEWVRKQPAWIEVLLRTGLYSAGVFVVLLVEKAFEGRHEYGGFFPSLTSLFQHADINHVVINTICLGGALLGFNVLWVVRRHLGEGGLIRLFLSPLPEEPAAQG